MFEELLASLVSAMSWPFLISLFVFLVAVLGKSASVMVDDAVALSKHWGVSSVIVGATIVSLGMAFPEVVVSVLAAMQGRPGLAMGNAVGTVITDTGLIVGFVALLGPVTLNRKVVNRQAWMQFASGLLLVLACFPFAYPENSFTIGSYLPQEMGFVFLVLLVLYLWLNKKWAAEDKNEDHDRCEDRVNVAFTLFKMSVALILLGASCEGLIASAREVASRLRVAESVIAASLVAFGTSLPELATAVTAVKKGYGEIAVGNVIGAGILNVLLVAGAAAAVTPGGLIVGPEFFRVYLPNMLAILLVFQIGIYAAKETFGKFFGVILLLLYMVTIFTGYLH